MAALHRPFFSKFSGARESLRTLLSENIQLINRNRKTMWRPRFISFQGSLKFVHSYRISPTGASMQNKELPSNYLRDKLMVPSADPPRDEDVDLLYQFFDRSSKLVILTGAGISTESGIPDYRSPNGAYSTGFRPITHQEFMRSGRARKRYWARSYAGWRKFTTAQPGPAHIALASLEKAGRIEFIMTQNVDRLHHRAGSNPLELHGTVYVVACTNCGFSFSRSQFQDQVKALNPKWADAIESLDYDSRSDKSFGMKQRPDGDIEIDEKFWEKDFYIPNCEKCNGILKPDVVFFGDNVPKGRADRAIEASKECDAFLVLGSSLMTMSAFRLIRTEGKTYLFLYLCLNASTCLCRAAHDSGAATAIVNIGTTRADDFVPLKINARVGEILPRLLSVGSLGVPVV